MHCFIETLSIFDWWLWLKLNKLLLLEIVLFTFPSQWIIILSDYYCAFVILESEINQLLGVFFNKLISQTNKDILFPCLVNAVNSIFNAPYDSTLHDIPPESIARFIIDTTRSDVASHVKLAKVFMEEMLNNASHKDTCVFLSKELLNLNLMRISNADMKNELKLLADKLIKVNERICSYPMNWQI